MNTPELISLLLPTRGRPLLAQRFFQSVLEKSTYLEFVEIILYVDEDDTESHHLNHSEIRIDKTVGPRLSMGGYNSYCLRRARGEIIILVNDDMVIRTEAWDEKVRATHASFPDGIYLAYGNDLFKGGQLCTFPIMSRQACMIIEDPYPLAYQGAFIDYHLFDIFKRLQYEGFDRIRYLEDVVFEHLHYRTGKAEIDKTYLRRGRFDDDATFLAFIEIRQYAAKRLLVSLNNGQIESYQPPDYSEDIPRNPLAALKMLTRRLLLDGGLPWRWRYRLWVWFYGRYLAARGWLWPFVRN